MHAPSAVPCMVYMVDVNIPITNECAHAQWQQLWRDPHSLFVAVNS